MATPHPSPGHVRLFCAAGSPPPPAAAHAFPRGSVLPGPNKDCRYRENKTALASQKSKHFEARWRAKETPQGWNWQAMLSKFPQEYKTLGQNSLSFTLRARGLSQIPGEKTLAAEFSTLGSCREWESRSRREGKWAGMLFSSTSWLRRPKHPTRTKVHIDIRRLLRFCRTLIDLNGTIFIAQLLLSVGFNTIWIIQILWGKKCSQVKYWSFLMHFKLSSCINLFVAYHVHSGTIVQASQKLITITLGFPPPLILFHNNSAKSGLTKPNLILIQTTHPIGSEPNQLWTT